MALSLSPKVQFGSDMVFPISSTDALNCKPIFKPQHRTSGPPTPILKRIIQLNQDDIGKSRAHPYRSPRPPLANVYKPSRSPNPDAGRRGENQYVVGFAAESLVTKKNHPPPMPVYATPAGWDRNTDVLAIPPSPTTPAPEPPLRTSSPPPSKTLRRKRKSDSSLPSEEAHKSKHKRSHARHSVDSFDLRAMASALPQPPSPPSTSFLHVDLDLRRPLSWSLFNAPSENTISLSALSPVPLAEHLDQRACPQATSINIHTHPWFDVIRLPGTATILDVLTAIHARFHEPLKQNRKKMPLEESNTIWANMVKRMSLRSRERKDVEDDRVARQIDMMDGFVAFRGLEIFWAHEGKLECQLHLRRDLRWDRWSSK